LELVDGEINRAAKATLFGAPVAPSQNTNWRTKKSMP
jgi:hypothetical protein